MHTPSAYTLTNTTRLHDKRKIRELPFTGGAAVELVLTYTVQCRYNGTTEHALHFYHLHLTIITIMTLNREVALVHERATPRALQHSIHESIALHTRTFLHLQFFTLSTLFDTLNCTRYGYVKPIDFVNCKKGRKRILYTKKRNDSAQHYSS